MRTAWGSYPPSPTDVSQSGPSEKHTPAVGSFRRGGESKRWPPPPPHPAPWVFGGDWQMQGRGAGWWGELLQVICTSKAALPPTLYHPASKRWLGLIALSKAAPVLSLLRFLGLTLPPHSQKPVQWHRGVKRRCKSAFLRLEAYLHLLISLTTNSNSFCLRAVGARAAGAEQ